MDPNKNQFEGHMPESYLVGYALRHGRITPEEAEDLHPDYAGITDKSDTRVVGTVHLRGLGKPKKK